MTTEEKRKALNSYCYNTDHYCGDCILADKPCDFGTLESERIDEAYNLVFGNAEETPHIKDSGERREFNTGAVRDIQEGKGRCDLLPLDVVGEYLSEDTIRLISEFQHTGDVVHLYGAINASEINGNPYDIVLEVSKHFEEGCKKYGENNWQKGIPVRCYIDSAIRHYLKWLRGDKDEPHDRAFCWNILCCIWTCIHKPELNDYKKDGDSDA